ncbi:hypothetical protein IWX48DRAFT_205329 [Phyllosticta citricarpa]
MRNAARAHPRRKQWSLSKHHSRGSRSCRSCQRQHHGGKKVAPKTTIPKNKQDGKAAVQACHGGATNNEHHGGLNNHSIIYKQCRFLQTRSSNSKRRKRQPPKHQNNEKKKKKKKKKPDAVAAMIQNHRTQTKHIQPPVNQFNQSTGRPTQQINPNPTARKQPNYMTPTQSEAWTDHATARNNACALPPTHAARNTQNTARNTQNTARQTQTTPPGRRARGGRAVRRFRC